DSIVQGSICCFQGHQSVFQSTLLLTHPGLQFLELLLASLHGQILSLIQTVLQVLDCDLQVLLHPLQVRAGVSLHLLLHPQGVIPAPDLRVQGALHGVNHPLAVPLDLLHLLVLLSDLPVHLTLDLVQLQLHTQNLGFLVLQCALNEEKLSVKSILHSAPPPLVTVATSDNIFLGSPIPHSDHWNKPLTIISNCVFIYTMKLNTAPQVCCVGLSLQLLQRESWSNHFCSVATEWL
uniref:Uncharacterized protein n=1 Tax=Oncorhynchus mykiss TaxID=8022 RepID=A0A8K9WR09_ONCMY